VYVCDIACVKEVAAINGELEEDEYKGSNIFLKGTQSANPHNDYSQHFIDTGQRAQNFIRDVGKGLSKESSSRKSCYHCDYCQIIYTSITVFVVSL